MVMSEQTRISEVNRLQHGHPAAWERFVKRFRPRIVEQCRRHAPSVSFEDLAQEVLLKLFENLPKFHHRGQIGSLRCWVQTITRTTIVDFQRAQQGDAVLPQRGGSDACEQLEQRPDSRAINVNALSDGIASSLELEPSFGLLAFRGEALQRIVGGLKKVEHLQAFLLMKVYNEKRKEVLAELGIAPEEANNISQAAHRLLDKLESVLREHVQKYLCLEPGKNLSKEDLDRVPTEGWHYMSKEMGRLLDDLWAVVEKKKKASELERDELPAGVIGQAARRLNDLVAVVADILSRQDSSMAAGNRQASD